MTIPNPDTWAYHGVENQRAIGMTFQYTAK